jgi:hypothetical protein
VATSRGGFSGESYIVANVNRPEDGFFFQTGSGCSTCFIGLLAVISCYLHWTFWIITMVVFLIVWITHLEFFKYLPTDHYYEPRDF